ncbi:NUDIX hydrolase [Candidatus Pacearchaeota archaeon]|nr:NUDIX hydrolase [Candidatus Pacearchaeota archaeon]
MKNNLGNTVDVIIEDREGIVLVKRKNPPFRGCWALPGGFLEVGEESLEQCGARETFEETGYIVKERNLKLLGVYSHPNRDPRGHIIAHVYIAKEFYGKLKAGDDAKEVGKFPRHNLPGLAFDHAKILKDYFAEYG